MATLPITSPYRGSSKHKNRPAKGAKGTLCPEWTHRTPTSGLGTNMATHAWIDTVAHVLFSAASHLNGKCFATQDGIAFEAKPTADGTWHGYPIPWESVPAKLLKQWLDSELVTAVQIRRTFAAGRNDIVWAMEMGAE